MTTGRVHDGPTQPLRDPLHDSHVACWQDAQLAVSLNERAIAAFEREHGPMTEEERRLVR